MRKMQQADQPKHKILIDLRCYTTL